MDVGARIDQHVECARFGVHSQRGGALPLWVEVHQQDTTLTQSEGMSHRDSRSSFPNPAFLIGNHDDFCRHVIPLLTMIFVFVQGHACALPKSCVPGARSLHALSTRLQSRPGRNASATDSLE